MDKILHFVVSFAIAYGILFTLARRNRTVKMPLWMAASSQAHAKRLLLLALGIGAVGTVFVGLAKEFHDRLGFGNYEIADMMANMAGIVLAVYLSNQSQKQGIERSFSRRNSGGPRRSRVRLVRSIPGHGPAVRPAREGLRLHVVVSRPTEKTIDAESAKHQNPKRSSGGHRKKTHRNP